LHFKDFPHILPEDAKVQKNLALKARVLVNFYCCTPLKNEHILILSYRFLKPDQIISWHLVSFARKTDDVKEQYKSGHHSFMT
jgi:hypothetical protein